MQSDFFGWALQMNRRPDGGDLIERHARDAGAGNLGYKREQPTGHSALVCARPSEQRLDLQLFPGCAFKLDVVDDAAPAIVLVDQRQIDELADKLDRPGRLHAWPLEVSR